MVKKKIYTNSTDAETFTITNAKIYVPVVTLSTQDNTKLLVQLRPGLKKTIKWNKYQSNVQKQTKTHIKIT